MTNQEKRILSAERTTSTKGSEAGKGLDRFREQKSLWGWNKQVGMGRIRYSRGEIRSMPVIASSDFCPSMLESQFRVSIRHI